MIALDTNVLARLLLGDDRAQMAQAKALLGKKQNYTAPITVMLELVWVLEANDCTAQEIFHGLRQLMALPNFEPAHATELQQAMDWYAKGMDFADAVHLALSAQADRLLTFDKRFAKQAQREILTGRVELVKASAALR